MFLQSATHTHKNKNKGHNLPQSDPSVAVSSLWGTHPTLRNLTRTNWRLADTTTSRAGAIVLVCAWAVGTWNFYELL